MPRFGQQLRANCPRHRDRHDRYARVVVNDQRRRMLGSREGQWGDWKLGAENTDMERVPLDDGKVHQRLAFEPGFLERTKVDCGMHDLEKLGPSVSELGRSAPLVEVP